MKCGRCGSSKIMKHVVIDVFAPVHQVLGKVGLRSKDVKIHGVHTIYRWCENCGNDGGFKGWLCVVCGVKIKVGNLCEHCFEREVKLRS